MIFKHLKAALAAFVVCVATASAQTTIVTASSLKMGGSPIAGGTVNITPTDCGGNPIPFTAGDGSLNSPQPFSAVIAGGLLASGFNVPDQALVTALSPNQSVCYSVTVLNTASKQSYAFVLPPGTLTGSVFDLGSYRPTQIAAALSGSGVGTALPYSGQCTAAAHFVLYSGTTITGVYDCINGTLRKEPVGTGTGSGVAPTITIGSVTQGTAAATLIGSNGAYTLNLTLPQGATGTNGTTPSFSVGSVTTGAAGSQASVSLTGTTTAPVLNFTIPQGTAGQNGTGGSGTSISLKVNGTANGSQTTLNLKAGSNVTLADDGSGGITVTSTSPSVSAVNTQIQTALANAGVNTDGTKNGAVNLTYTGTASIAPAANTVQQQQAVAVTTPYAWSMPGTPPPDASHNCLGNYTINGFSVYVAQWVQCGATPASTLVDNWPLSDTTGSESVAGNNLTLTGANATTDATLGNVVTFSGANSGGISTSNTTANFTNTQAFTLAAWVKPTSVSGGANQEVVSTLSPNAPYQGYSLVVAGSTVLAQFINSTDSGNLMQCSTASGAVAANTLAHIGVTYSGASTSSGVQLYVNGQPVATTCTGTLSGSIAAGNKVSIGNSVSGNYFTGVIARVKVDSTAYSASAMLSLYNSKN